MVSATEVEGGASAERIRSLGLLAEVTVDGVGVRVAVPRRLIVSSDALSATVANREERLVLKRTDSHDEVSRYAPADGAGPARVTGFGGRSREDLGEGLVAWFDLVGEDDVAHYETLYRLTAVLANGRRIVQYGYAGGRLSSVRDAMGRETAIARKATAAPAVAYPRRAYVEPSNCVVTYVYAGSATQPADARTSPQA
jgi:YD repeat-containing protein